MSDVARLTELPPVRYMYRRNGLISKTVHYFLFQSAAKEKLRPQRKEGIRQAQWMPIDEALAIIGYAKTNTSLLLKVKQWILSSRPT
ncbi:MAG: hypothetical protein UY49_C0021G0010 [Microgenomates group bacterium GW2011_GWC1_49_7]|nr:MAG: hypothetical protein UY49_C0021G0010 [Microgenomates group bacterium GW2011_GWC1_49_7]